MSLVLRPPLVALNNQGNQKNISDISYTLIASDAGMTLVFSSFCRVIIPQSVFSNTSLPITFINLSNNRVVISSQSPFALSRVSGSSYELLPYFSGVLRFTSANSGVFTQDLRSFNYKPTNDPNLLVWYDPSNFSDSNKVTHVDGSVSSLRDQGPNGYHLLQPTVANQPGISGFFWGAQNGLFFTQSNADRLDASISVPCGNMSGAMLVRFTTANRDTISPVLFEFYNTAANLRFAYVLNGSGIFLGYNNGSGFQFAATQSYVAPASVWILLGFIFDNSTGQFYYRVNGGEIFTVISTAVFSGTFTNLRVGDDSTLGNALSATIGDFAVLSTISTSSLEQLEGFMAHKYNLQSSVLRADHPYKTTSP